jgi:16S rRNA (uracil1498-N3)-methyltransferase
MLASRRVVLKLEDRLDDRIATRLYLAEQLAAGIGITLGTAVAHRLRHVLRLEAGAAVAGFNARDGEWLCRIAELARGRVALSVLTQRRAAAPEPDLWLVFAPIRRARLDWLVEKATELGVAALLPVATARTQAAPLNRDHLAAVVVAAAEQSERLSVPEIRPTMPLNELLGDWNACRRLIVCDESGAGRPIAEALREFPAGAPAALLIGPEGGFASSELDAFADLPFVTRVGLGPLVLRAETAALAALAVFLALAGNWRAQRGG